MQVNSRITMAQFLDYTGGLTPVNCGELYLMSDGLCVEVLRPETTGHAVPMVVVYKKLGNLKAELVFPNNFTFTVYRFKGYRDLQHYWSRNIPMNGSISPDYLDMLERAKAYWDVFFTH